MTGNGGPTLAIRRRGPGRPRKPLPGPVVPVESGHNVGTATAHSRINGGGERGALARLTVAPVQARLLDLQGASAYLGVSGWTVRDLEAAGILPRVRIPLPNAGELRKLLFDRTDLDRLIETWKDPTHA